MPLIRWLVKPADTKAFPVVFHDEPYGFGVSQKLNIRFMRPGVFDSIIERFLCNAIQTHFDRRIQPSFNTIGSDLHLELAALREMFRKKLKSRDQAEIDKDARHEDYTRFLSLPPSLRRGGS